MERSIQNFTSPEFGEIRVIEVSGEPWMVANDVANALGYQNPRDAIRKHVDEEDVAKCDTLSDGGIQSMNIINESGFYSLVMGSKLPRAKEFKRWVTSEVLPSIRKYGVYATIPQNYPDALIALANEVREREKIEAELKIAAPKAQVYDEFVEKGHLIGFRDLAKQLKIKETMLREILFNMGWCYRGQNGKLQPYKIYCDAGYLTVKDVLNKQTGYTGTRCLFTIQGRDQLKKVIDNIRESGKETSKKKKLQSLIDRAINQPDDELEVG